MLENRLLDQTDDTNTNSEIQSNDTNTSEVSDVPSETATSPANDSNAPKKSPLELLKEAIPSLEEKEQFVLDSIIGSMEAETLTKQSYSGHITSMRVWYLIHEDNH